MSKEKALTLKTLSKGIVWELQENDIFRLWKEAEKDADLKDNQRHYLDIIRTAFEIEEVPAIKHITEKLEARGFKIGQLKISDKDDKKWGIKKRPISRITDLTYENIRHISVSKLLEVIDKNFGGGWDSISQSIQDIILSGFDISTTTLPKDRLHNPGGMYEKKVADDFEVLEIVKGSWVEAIFAKAKPVIAKEEKVDDLKNKKRLIDDEDDDEEDLPEIEDKYSDEEDDFDEDALDEESYRTTYDADTSDLSLDDVAASEDEY